jgi:hypothetical protein
VRGVLWAAALAIDFGTPLVRGVKGLQVHAQHFTDRHGLVIILALGESIAGIGAFRLRMTGTIRVARLVVAALSCALLPVALAVPSIVTLALSAALAVGLVAFETLFPDKFHREVKENG